MNLHANARTCPKGRQLLVDRVEGWMVGDGGGRGRRNYRPHGEAMVARWRAEGPTGLLDRSSAPHRIPHKTPPDRVAQIVRLRRLRMTAAQIAIALSARTIEDERLLEAIREVHAANYYAYGYRRTWNAMLRAGEDVGRDRVKRLMRRERIRGAKQAVAHDDRRPGCDQVARSRQPCLQRRPPRSALGRGLHLPALLGGAGVLQLRHRRPRSPDRGLAVRGSRTDLVLDALRIALTRRPPGAEVELVHHSDAGSQYTSFAFRQVLDDDHVLGSIGSVGDAYDNAIAESFVDTFKTELIADRVWRTRSQLELAIVEWVAWFNNDRLHERLGDRPPAEVETLYAEQYVPAPFPHQ